MHASEKKSQEDNWTLQF